MKERKKGKESLWLLEALVRKIILQMHTPACTSQCWSRQTRHGLGVCIWMHLVNGMGQQPVSGTADPGVVKQDKSSRGSVDTTKTRSDPQRVRMSCGERPIGAAKGKQPDTEALCHPPTLRRLPFLPPDMCLAGLHGSPQTRYQQILLAFGSIVKCP